MLPPRNGLVWLDDLTGGLNDTDAPQDIGDTQCQIAQNVEWATTRGVQRRQGGTDGINATEPWGANASLFALLRHTPTADESAAELWGVDSQATPVMARCASGGNPDRFFAVTVGDAWTQANTKLINGVSLSGRFYLAGDTAQDRMHVWDGSSLRRVGVATSAAPTVADTGAGTYPATLRFYKVQWLRTVGAVTQYSELTPAVSFTPSGAGTHARVTQPTVPTNEGITNWQVFGSPDGVNYYLIAFVAVGTTTFDDNTAPADYAAVFPTSAGFPTDADYFTPPISAKYVLADEDRLLLLSSWETASMASAVMWTPVIGTTPAVYGVTDEERIPSTNRLDLDRGDGGGITGGGLLDGVVYVFKLSQIHRLDRTGDVSAPYKPKAITKKLGALSHKSIVEGEDDAGNPCLYFLSRRGPYRLGPYGLEYLGRDIETLWDDVNFAGVTPPFGVWHEKKRQVQWWITTSSGGAKPDTKIVFHARYGRRDDAGQVRGGWAIHTEGAADAHCACMFANTLNVSGVGDRSLDLKPYVGQVWVSGLPDGPCIKYDADGSTTDRGGLQTTYVARARTLAFPPGGHGNKGRVTQTYVLGKSNASACTLDIDVIRDFGGTGVARSGTAALPTTGGGGASRRVVKVEDDAASADAMYVEVEISDADVTNALWTVDAIGLRVKPEGPI